MHATVKKILKIIGWIAASVVFLLVAIALAIQIPSVQTWLTQKAVTFLKDKIGTEVRLAGISISFPKAIVLKGIYLEDQQADTLLFVDRLSVDTDLLALTRNEIQLNKIYVKDLVGNVHRNNNDSSFNFTYIVDAFAGDSTAVPDTVEQKGWNITLETLELENIRLRYDDELQGDHALISLGEFEINMETFDLANNTFAVEDVTLADTQASVKQTKLEASGKEEDQKEDSAAATIFSLETVLLSNVNLSYEQLAAGQAVRMNIGEFSLRADKMDLVNQEIALGKITLTNSILSLEISRPDTLQKEEDTTATGTSPDWRLSVNELALANNSIRYNDLTQAPAEGSLDFNRIGIEGLNIDARGMAYNADDIRMTLNNLSFKEQSGFALRKVAGKFGIGTDEASIDGFQLITDNSQVAMQVSARYPSLNDIGNSWQKMVLDFTMTNSHIGLADVLLLNPTILDSVPLTLTPSQKVRVDADVKGRVDDLVIGKLGISAFSGTRLDASGKVKGLPDPEKLQLDLELDDFRTTRIDVENVLPDTLLSDSVRLPEWLSLKARYRGSPERGEFETTFASSAGSAKANGKMDLDSASTTRGFSAILQVNDLNVGSILGKPDSVMGALTMHAEVNAKGLAIEELDGELKAAVDEFSFQNYKYQDLKVDGSIRNQLATLTAVMEDENLNFDIDAKYLMTEEVPKYDFTFDLRNADFRALNLSVSPIKARGTLDVDLATSDFRILNGDVDIRKVAIFNGDDLYAVDSLLFASIDQEGRSEIKIDSDLMEARFEGSFNIFDLPSVLQQYFHSYFQLHDSLDVINAPHQHFNFEVQLRNTDLLTELLVPDLKKFKPGPLQGRFDSKARELVVNMDIEEIQYGNIGIKSLNFQTDSDSETLMFDLLIDRIMIDSMRIDGVDFKGNVRDNVIGTDLAILDSVDQRKYVLAANILSRDNGFDIQLSPDKIVLNYDVWRVPQNNVIRLGGDKLVAQNVELSKGDEKLILQSEDRLGTPINIGFRQMNLEHLVSMIAEERLVSGLLNGDVQLFPSETSMAFASDLSVRDLRVRDFEWGDLGVHVSRQNGDRFDVDVSLEGNGNEVRVGGFYIAGESPSLDVTANVNRFLLESLQPLLLDQVRDLKGILTGSVQVKGSTARPDIDGKLTVQQTEFFSMFLNTGFAIKDEGVVFNNQGISFDNFDIADKSGNNARLNGSIATRDYTDFRFRLDLTADNFRLIDTKEGDNDLFYGRIDIDAKARIRGDMTTPLVDVTIGMAEGSNLTYIVPQAEASALEAEGIVKFKDRSFEGDPFMQQVNAEASDTIKSTFRGIDLTARIELTDQETFTIVLDPITQDQLSIRGNSTLTLKVDPTGDMNLTGRYEIEEGTYNLSFYKFVKREFAIEKGSSITWLGDPLNAQMDIRAIYNIQTSPIELVANQFTGSDQSELNQYRQRLPFQVYLNLKGELLRPEVGFKLDMPMDQRSAFGGNVYARLQDINTRESDLNKQVFALLILKRFISEDPFENRAGGGLAGTARSSVSKILSEQLNRLGENIKGVELSFDIKSYEDYTSGQAQGQTELELGVSKSFLNDRLVVKLSGNVDIEGQNSSRSATDYIGDLALEYKITPDGRFRITGFRNSNYDMIDGELIETGAGLIYVKDYNALRELFKSNAETRK